MDPFELRINPETGEEEAIPVSSYNPLVERPELFQKYLEVSGIPKKYWDLDFDNYIGTKSKDDLKKAIWYARNFDEPQFEGKGLYLYGPNNTQKTTVMVSIMKEVMRRGKFTLYLQASQLQKILKNEDAFQPESDLHDIYEKCTNGFYEIIAIDDGFSPVKTVKYAGDKGNYIVAWWDDFLRTVLQNNQKLLLTSNVPMNEVKQNFSKDIQLLMERDIDELVFIDNVEVLLKDRKKSMWEGMEV